MDVNSVVMDEDTTDKNPGSKINLAKMVRRDEQTIIKAELGEEDCDFISVVKIEVDVDVKVDE